MQRILLPAAAALALIMVSTGPVRAQTTPGKDFNEYILRAVKLLGEQYPARGYDQASYTHTLDYGPAEANRVRPSRAPYTMCVAAVAEVIVTALDLYMKDHKAEPEVARRILAHLPPEGWMRMRPKDIRSHLWVDSHLRAYGTADALSTFGVGRHADFNKLRPGAFVNLNRTTKSGHAVVFLGYIDEKGNDLAAYGPTVAGFRYFSSQGKTRAPGSGFGYRWAFFDRNGASYCPVLGSGRKVDCRIIARRDQNNLNTGYMLHPQYWDIAYRDRSLKLLADKLYTQDYVNRAAPKINLPRDLTRQQFAAALETTDTMTTNPNYLNQEMPEER